METTAIPVTIPNDILVALNETEQELKNYFQSGIAMLLFQEGKLSFGKAMQLSGLSRYAFEQLLTQNSIPFSNTTADEVFTDLAKLNNL
jgi:predicted HTH domain antitoxin